MQCLLTCFIDYQEIPQISVISLDLFVYLLPINSELFFMIN